MNILHSKGKTSSDIVVHQLRGYMAWMDKKLLEYMGKCFEEHKEGENITYQHIMLKTESKYKARMMSN